jgi:hypothetical protein
MVKYTVKTLTAAEKEKFLREHLRHRLTLLRTLRERTKIAYNFQGQGDIARCVKDSNLMAVRLLLDFLGLKGHFNGSDFVLKRNPRNPKFPDDVKIDQFIGKLLKVDDVPASKRKVLAGVYMRADKELAHLTLTFNKEFNEPARLIEAVTAVEELLKKFLYEPLREPLPEMDA